MLSEGGPLGREEDRWEGLRRDAPSLLMAAAGSRTRSGLSELIRASMSEDMMISCPFWAVGIVVESGGAVGLACGVEIKDAIIIYEVALRADA